MKAMALGAALVLVGCGSVDSEDSDACKNLNSQLAACMGDSYSPISCRGISDADVELLTGLVNGVGCTLVANGIPADGDLLVTSCRLLGLGCAAARNPVPQYSPTLYPIVLVNGIDVSPLFRYSGRIVNMMREVGGHDVYLAIDTPYETPQRRARDLWQRVQEIKAQTGAEKVNLVAHSLGGLDCRYLVSPGGLHWDVDASHDEIVGSVASITMISTAHRGTRAADAALGYLPDTAQTVGIDRLATLLGEGFTQKNLQENVHLRESIQALSTSQAAAFNNDVPDEPQIYYQSWGGFSRPLGLAPAGHDDRLAELCQTSSGESGLSHFFGDHDFMAAPLVPSADIVGTDPENPGVLIPNDGLATVASARWGNFRGCIPADHMEQLGQINLPDVNVRTGFDIARFYTNLAADLSERGF